MKKRFIGNWLIAALGVINLTLWIVFPPPNDSRPLFTNQMAGEMFSTTALILMGSNLFLAARPRFLEPLFGGLDQMYQAHKKTAIIAAILLFAHFLTVPSANNFNLGEDLGILALAGILSLVLLALTVRIPFIGGYIKLRYDQWKLTHRFIGVFFITGIIHSLVVANTLIVGSPIVSLYVYTIAYAAAGVYLYKEFLEDRFRKKHAYIVEQVKPLSGGVVEVTLKPQQEKLTHRAGQFLYIRFDGDQVLREPHPFTISSSPGAEHIRLAIRAIGDFTQHLYAHLQKGMLARLEGGFGMFDYHEGAKQQIWVAGGIGITPFLSWMRDFKQDLPYEVDFYYSVRAPDEAIYLDEIEQVANSHSSFRNHIAYSNRDGRLTADKIVASSGAPRGKDVYLCGPIAMIEALQKQFIQLGVPRQRIHFEEFNFR
jgi:predicted ferric reductase